MMKPLIIFLGLIPALGHCAAHEIQIPLHCSSVNLNPALIQDEHSLWISRQINCELIHVNQGEFAPELATSVQIIDPTHIDIFIQKNKYFSDGTPVTADDVIASFQYLKMNRSVYHNFFEWIKTIKKLNSHSIEFVLKKPIPRFLSVLASPNYPILSAHFIELAQKNPSLWKNPVGCGSYKVSSNTAHSISLEPIHGGLPVKFAFVSSGDLTPSLADQFDLIPLRIEESPQNIQKQFNKIQIFDPFQFYLGLNTTLPQWKHRKNRCAFFAHYSPQKLLDAYGSRVIPANDFFPEGILGYHPHRHFMAEIKHTYAQTPLPPLQHFCFSYLASSISNTYVPAFIQSLKDVYPTLNIKPMNSAVDYAHHFLNEQCDAYSIAFKGNYYDGYEFLITLSEPNADYTGYLNPKIEAEIRASQLIGNREQRAQAYQNISDQISKRCVVYPLFTLPYDVVYLKKGLHAPGIGEQSLNNYDLSHISSVSS